MRIKTIILVFSIFTLAITACSTVPASATLTASPELNVVSTITLTQTQAPTQIVKLTPTQIPSRPPASEADVPRVTVENAKAAFDSGKAIIVDVRSQSSFDALHIYGAIYIPLADFESNSANLPFDKDQWIITYCT